MYVSHAAVTQDLQDQEEAGEEDEAEQAHPSLDPHEDRQHHQVQCEAQALAPYQARSSWLCLELQFQCPCSCYPQMNQTTPKNSGGRSTKTVGSQISLP
ncbi:60S ribosomal protein [Salix suchowensis]|nr:60S ribosomal protein [Salix suchowensis]